MSLLVDLQLVPQRILEKVRAAVLQNREALRHGGIRSRVNQATKQRPQFTKVGATMRDYKAPVPVATGLPEPDQNLAWAYVIDPIASPEYTRGLGVKHIVYSADGSAQFSSNDEESFTSYEGGSVHPRQDQYVYQDSTGAYFTPPWAYPSDTTLNYPENPEDELQQLGVQYLSLGFAVLPTASAYTLRYVKCDRVALPVGRDQVIIQYCSQLVTRLISEVVVYRLNNPVPNAWISVPPTTVESYVYHQVVTASEVRHWAVLVGPDYAKEIEPSEAIATLINESNGAGFFVPGTYTNPDEMTTFEALNFNPPGLRSQPSLSESGINRLIEYGAYGVNFAEKDFTFTPGIYEYLKQQEKIVGDWGSAQTAGEGSAEWDQFWSFQYLSSLVPTWVKRLRPVTAIHPEIIDTLAKWIGPFASVESDPFYLRTDPDAATEGLLSTANVELDLWAPVIKSAVPPSPGDNDFPQKITDDYTSHWLSYGSYLPPLVDYLQTYLAYDWGRPSYCRQQLLELGFTDADLAPPTPTP